MPRKAPPPEQGKTEGRTAWHVLLARLLKQRAPSSFRVLSEVPLGNHPPRADLLLLRREGTSDDHDAAVLRDLWRRIKKFGLLEYKSPSETLRSGDLAKLFAYLMLYLADHPEEADRDRANVLLGLVLPSVTPFLEEELAFFGWHLGRRGGGYHEVQGTPVPLLVIELDEVSAAERDELLGVFGHGKVKSPATVAWWQEQTGEKMAELSQMEGYDEVVQRFIDSLTPEQRLAGLAPEQRLADLGDRAILAMPDHLLKMLPDEAFTNLPSDVRDAIRKRIGR
jgi:hypothetical protein